jgi:hypothetical protein
MKDNINMDSKIVRQWMVVVNQVTACWSTLHILIFFDNTALPNWTKPDKDGP